MQYLAGRIAPNKFRAPFLVPSRLFAQLNSTETRWNSNSTKRQRGRAQPYRIEGADEEAEGGVEEEGVGQSGQPGEEEVEEATADLHPPASVAIRQLGEGERAEEQAQTEHRARQLRRRLPRAAEVELEDCKDLGREGGRSESLSEARS